MLLAGVGRPTVFGLLLSCSALNARNFDGNFHAPLARIVYIIEY